MDRAVDCPFQSSHVNEIGDGGGSWQIPYKVGKLAAVAIETRGARRMPHNKELRHAFKKVGTRETLHGRIGEAQGLSQAGQDRVVVDIETIDRGAVGEKRSDCLLVALDQAAVHGTLNFKQPRHLWCRCSFLL